MLLGALFAACDPSGGGGSSNPQPPTPPKPKAWHVTTFAGGGPSGTDGIGPAAGFAFLFGIAQSGDTLYVTDFTRHSLRTVHTTTARVGTIVTGGTAAAGHLNGAGTSARFNFPSGAAAAAGGTLYVADFRNHRVREVRAGANAAATQVSTLAGSGTPGDTNGAGTTALFDGPRDLALSRTTLYVSDQNNHRIRAIDLASPNKAVSTLAGSGMPGDTNGADTVARFNNPTGLAIRETTLYVAEYNGHRIRAIDLTSGTVSDVAGNASAGDADGAGTTAQFRNPTGLAIRETTLYVAEYNGHRIRAIDLASANKTVSTIAGSGTAGHANGTGTAAQFDTPIGLAVSGSTLYVADYNNHRIRAIDIAGGTVRDIAGDGTAESTNGIGTAARFNKPTGIIAVSENTLYIATEGKRIRKLEYREVD